MTKNQITQSVIISLATVFASLAWYSLRRALYNDLGGGVSTWLLPFFCFLGLGVLVSLFWLLIESRILLFVTVGIITFSFLLAFPFQVLYLLLLGLSLLLMWFGSLRAIDEKKVRIKIRPSRIFHQGLPLFFLGLALMVTGAYYFSPGVQAMGREIRIPLGFMSVAEESVKRIFDKIMPGLDLEKFSLDMTVDEFLETTAKEEIVKQEGIDPEMLESPQIKTMIKEKLEQIQSQFREQFEIVEMTGKEKLSELVSKLALEKIQEFLGPYARFIPLALAISFFVALRMLSFLFVWIVILLACSVFKLLLLLKAIKIEKKMVEMEVIRV